MEVVIERERQLKYNEESQEGALRVLVRFYSMRLRKEILLLVVFFGLIASL